MQNLSRLMGVVALAGAVCLLVACADLLGPGDDAAIVGVATKPGLAQGEKLASILHKGKLILVSQNAVPAHLAHGDQLPFTGTAQLPGGATMEFVYIEPGTFMMGSPDTDPDTEEKPQHQVTISQGFYLGKYVVTQGQWEAVMGSNPSYCSGSNKPVERVSWDDAQDFIRKLNATAGN